MTFSVRYDRYLSIDTSFITHLPNRQSGFLFIFFLKSIIIEDLSWAFPKPKNTIGCSKCTHLLYVCTDTSSLSLASSFAFSLFGAMHINSFRLIMHQLPYASCIRLHAYRGFRPPPSAAKRSLIVLGHCRALGSLSGHLEPLLNPNK